MMINVKSFMPRLEGVPLVCAQTFCEQGAAISRVHDMRGEINALHRATVSGRSSGFVVWTRGDAHRGHHRSVLRVAESIRGEEGDRPVSHQGNIYASPGGPRPGCLPRTDVPKVSKGHFPEGVSFDPTRILLALQFLGMMRMTSSPSARPRWSGCRRAAGRRGGPRGPWPGCARASRRRRRAASNPG